MTKKTVLKAVVSITAILIIVKTISGESITNYNLKLSFSYLASVFLVSLVNMGIITYKWQLIIHSNKVAIGFFNLVKVYYISNFFAQVTPIIVGDSMRAYHLSKYTQEKMNSIGSVLWVRLTGFLAQMILILISLPFVVALGYKFILTVAFLIVSVFILLAIIIMNPSEVASLILKLSRLHKKLHFLHYLEKFSVHMMEYSRNKKFFFIVLLLSILDHLTRIVACYLISLSIGFNLNFFYFLIFTPIAMMVQMVPISLGGTGIREGTYMILFTKVGLSSVEALVLSIFTYIMTIITTLPGLYFFLAGTKSGSKIAEIKYQSD